ncbi:MAG: hypothetical protein ACOCY0_00045 [Roseicyclus sp.]
MVARDRFEARLRGAASLALAGSASLFAALLIHELVSFGGAARGLIGSGAAPCPAPPCLTLGVVVSGQVAKAVGAAFVFAAIGAIWMRGQARWTVAVVYWALQYLWALLGIASGYRAQFGSGWAWWEPFAVLLWHPLLTPGLMLAGLAACLGLDRRFAPRPPAPPLRARVPRSGRRRA